MTESSWETVAEGTGTPGTRTYRLRVEGGYLYRFGSWGGCSMVLVPANVLAQSERDLAQQVVDAREAIRALSTVPAGTLSLGDRVTLPSGEEKGIVAVTPPRQRYFVMRGDLVSGCTKAYAVISVDRGRVYESDSRSEAIASAQSHNGFTPADGLESTYERQSRVGVVGGEP